MPIYIYRNPKTKEVKEVVQRMTEEHSYSEDGQQWERVFVCPNASFDTVIDANNPKDFLRATNKKMTLGEMWDESGRLSEKRKQKFGFDPVKDKTVARYEKRCKKRHPLKDPEKVNTISHILE